MTGQLVICETTIRQDSEGRYCLNDLHKAAGGAEKHTPNRFTRTANYLDLLDELTPVLAFGEKRVLAARIARGGAFPGTYVCKELVYAYAMWISPAFQLKVIRAYDTLQTQGVAVAEHAAADFLADSPCLLSITA